MNPSYVASTMRSTSLHNPLMTNIVSSNVETSDGMTNNVNTALNQLSNMSIHNPQHEKNVNSQNVLNGQTINKSDSGSAMSHYSPHIPSSTSVPGVLNGNFVNANINSDKYLPLQPLGINSLNQTNQPPG